MSRAQSEPASHVARAWLVLAVAAGHSDSAAVRAVGRRSVDAIAQLVARFNVFDVWRTVEHLAGDVLATMDNCRISWGVVQAVEGAEVLVERRPIALHEGKLVLGEPQRARATRLFEGQGFVQAVAPGDVVSLHWNWVCEVLTERQVRALERATVYHLALASQTI